MNKLKNYRETVELDNGVTIITGSSIINGDRAVVNLQTFFNDDPRILVQTIAVCPETADALARMLVRIVLDCEEPEADSKTMCDDDIKTKVLKWFATGKVGESSRVMALVACGLKDLLKGYDVPEDPSDFNRCLLLLDAVPEIRTKMDDIAALGGRWAKLVPRWAEIEKCFEDEAGPNWAFSDNAPRTYQLMKEIYQ